MALRTASVSGKWSQTATWGGAAVPVDLDTFVINSGVLVEFDVDQSGFATGLGASTVNGTLYGSRTAGTYYLKMSNVLTISGTGTLDISDGSGGVYPSNCTMTVKFAYAGAVLISVNSAANINIICAEPTHRYARLSQAESASATTLHIDTDLTIAGDSPYWVNTAEIYVCNINQAIQTEARSISSVTSSTIVITAGLTASKLIGSFVVLTNRNVKFIGNSVSTGLMFAGGGNVPLLIGAEIRTMQVAFSINNAVINGVQVGGVAGIQNGYNTLVHGVFVALTANVFNIAYSGHMFDGICIGCGQLAFGGNPRILSGAIIAGCTTAISSGGEFQCSGAQFIGNGTDLFAQDFATFFNTLLGSTVEFTTPTANRSSLAYVESYDHDQVAGAFKAWCRGGNVVNTGAVVFDASRPRSYQHTPSSASFPVFMQRKILVPAGASLYVRCYVRKDVSMAYLPRLWVMTADKEPLVTGSPDSEIVMTNSNDTWEILETTVTNTTDSDKVYIVRTIAKNASGNVYFDPLIRVSSYQANPAMVGGLAS